MSSFDQLKELYGFSTLDINDLKHQIAQYPIIKDPIEACVNLNYVQAKLLLGDRCCYDTISLVESQIERLKNRKIIMIDDIVCHFNKDNNGAELKYDLLTRIVFVLKDKSFKVINHMNNPIVKQMKIKFTPLVMESFNLSIDEIHHGCEAYGLAFVL